MAPSHMLRGNLRESSRHGAVAAVSLPLRVPQASCFLHTVVRIIDTGAWGGGGRGVTGAGDVQL